MKCALVGSRFFAASVFEALRMEAGIEFSCVVAPAEDRVGIVSSLTKMLAERGISIESIHTDIVRSGVFGKQTFKIGAHLLAPAALPADELRRDLGTLASELMLDIALGERPAAP